MTIKDLQDKKLIIFECISGSRAYGTNLPKSDTDIRGVFVLPEKDFYSLNYIPQVADTTNDTVYYELKRFIELLADNNPNILELLNAPEDCILQKHEIMNMILAKDFLTKKCEKTFAGYAYSQIHKARGLNKKIFNPVEQDRKTILHFCHITQGNGSMPLLSWLEKNQLLQENCGLSAIPHFKDIYALFYDENNNENQLNYKGISKKEEANDVLLSSIPKEQTPKTYLYFNKEGYSSYCKSYKEYWDWVEKRNAERYENTLSHGKNYDSKNLMHTLRLLDMAEEIATLGKVIVRRPNREYLLKVRLGKFSYQELLDEAEKRIENMENLYKKSALPEDVNKDKINLLLFEMRKVFYGK
jgi:uncharacterized protein